MPWKTEYRNKREVKSERAVALLLGGSIFDDSGLGVQIVNRRRRANDDALVKPQDIHLEEHLWQRRDQASSNTMPPIVLSVDKNGLVATSTAVAARCAMRDARFSGVDRVRAFQQRNVTYTSLSIHRLYLIRQSARAQSCISLRESGHPAKSMNMPRICCQLAALHGREIRPKGDRQTARNSSSTMMCRREVTGMVCMLRADNKELKSNSGLFGWFGDGQARVTRVVTSSLRSRHGTLIRR